MKKASSCILALVLAVGSSVALGAPGHGDRHHKDARQHRADKHHKVGRHHDVPRMSHSARHHKKQLRHHRKHQVQKRHLRHHKKHHGWHYQRWDRHGWRHDGWRRHSWNHGRRYYGDYLGAALVGSALTYSFYHLHGGAVCYDHHDDRRSTGYRDRGYSEVVGCHRIERLEDGTEVRVDVPLSQCR